MIHRRDPVTKFASEQAVTEPGAADPGHLTTPARLSRPRAERRRWWRDAFRRRMLAGADLAAVIVALSIAETGILVTPWALVLLALSLLLAKLFGLYERDHRALRHLTADEIPVIAGWAAAMAGLLALLAPLTVAGGQVGGVAVFFAVLTAATVSLRSLARWAWWRRTPPELVGLIGDGEPLESLHRKLRVFREMHFELAAERLTGELGSGEQRTDQLSNLADRVDRIVVAASGLEADLIAELKVLCRRRQLKLSVVSPLRGGALPSGSFPKLVDLPILEYNTWDPSRSTLLIKRVFDFVAASVGLLLLAPALLVIAIAIKLDSPGPVMFSQIRAGFRGRPFRMYKLRTMTVDAEARLDGLVDINELAEPVFKLRGDPRITRVGRFLRRFSLDETPQLINVLLGEMSIVGPRPEQIELVERYSRRHRVKLGVKPGVTGPMQVFGRGELTFSERLAIELEYVENQSLTRDLRILIHTLPAVFRGTGAF